MSKHVLPMTLAGSALAVLFGGTAVSQPPPKQHTVVMANMSYGRLPANVRAGDSIVWVNRDTVPHTATARNKSFDVRVQAGRRVRMVVRKAGAVSIYCIWHPAMRGTLRVAP